MAGLGGGETGAGWVLLVQAGPVPHPRLMTPEQQRSSGFLSPSNKSDTLPLATRYNIKCVGLSPDGRLAIIVDEGNRARPRGGDGMGW